MIDKLYDNLARQDATIYSCIRGKFNEDIVAVVLVNLAGLIFTDDFVSNISTSIADNYDR